MIHKNVLFEFCLKIRTDFPSNNILEQIKNDTFYKARINLELLERTMLLPYFIYFIIREG